MQLHRSAGWSMDLVADYDSDSEEETPANRDGSTILKSPVTKGEGDGSAITTQSKSLLECSSSSSNSEDDGDDSPRRASTTKIDASPSKSKAQEHTPLPLPEIATFVPTGESAIFKPATKGLYDSVSELPGVKRQRSVVDESAHSHHQYNIGEEQGSALSLDEDAPRKRKKRHGVTDTLKPPQRAVKPLRDQIHREQPWLKQNKR